LKVRLKLQRYNSREVCILLLYNITVLRR